MIHQEKRLMGDRRLGASIDRYPWFDIVKRRQVVVQRCTIDIGIQGSPSRSDAAGPTVSVG